MNPEMSMVDLVPNPETNDKLPYYVWYKFSNWLKIEFKI